MTTQSSALKIIHICLGSCTTIVALMVGAVTQANSMTNPSRASINASIGIPVALIDGSAHMFKDAGQFSVTGIKTVGNVSVITLRGVAGGAEASVQISS